MANAIRVFLAGGSGAIGRSLVPMLVGAGYEVVAMTRSAERGRALESLGAKAVIGDVYDSPALAKLVADAKPQIVMHQLTAFGSTAGDPFAETIRIRTEGTRNLVAAAQAAHAARFVSQSISFICTPNGSGLTDETTPLYVDGGEGISPLANAIAELEQRSLSTPGIDGLVLRYGWFYGPGTNYDPNDSIPRAIRKGRMAIVGEGAGTYSFIHVDDAAAATMAALDHGATGVYNIVDDEPARLSEWLPVAAELLGGPPPPRVDVSTAREKLGNLMVYAFNEQRGASNAKAKRDLAWTPDPPSWRVGFKQLYA